MATFEDLKIVLDSIDINISQQGAMLSSMAQIDNQQVDLLAEQNSMLQKMLSAQERATTLGDASRASVSPQPMYQSSSGGSTAAAPSSAGKGGFSLGTGLGIGAAGIGLAKGAGGLAMMGLGISAFFGGLVAGDATLGWMESMGASFKFDNLKSAALGFSDMIVGMDPKSFIVLGGIMGISAIGGKKAAIGLGSMGFAISAFLGGLMAGDLIFGGVSALGGDMKFSSMKEVMSGFSDMILEIDPKALAVLGGIMGISAIAGLKGGTSAAVGLGAMGAGISGFLGGLLAGDLIFSGVSALGGNINFSSLKTVMGGFSNVIGELTPGAITAMVGILGAATGAAVFGRGSGVAAATRVAATMTGIGAGIAGLMLGLGVGGAGVDWLNSAVGFSGGGLPTAFKMFSDAIGELTTDGTAALVGILGVGGLAAAFGSGTGIGAVTRVTTIMAGIGAGISGLMIGLTAGDKAMSWMSSLKSGSGGLVNAFKMFNDSIGELDNENSITALVGILGAGVGLGTLLGVAGSPAAAVMAGVGIFAIMTAIGAGISGLMIGLTLGDVGLSWLDKLKGSGGGGLVNAFKMFSNSITAITPDALKRLTEISKLNLGSGISDLVSAVTNFFAIDVKEGVGDRVRGFFTSLFGGTVEKESIISKLINEFEPLSGSKGNQLVTGMERFAMALEPLANALSTLSGIDPGSINFREISKNLAETIPIFNHLANGGVYDPSWMPGNAIDFGDGLLDPKLKLDEVTSKITSARNAIIGIIDNETMQALNLVSSGAGAAGGGNQITLAPVTVSPTTNNSVQGGSSSTVINSLGKGNTSDLDQFSRPGGVH